MQSNYTLELFLNMFYLDANIPIYLYKGDKILFYRPDSQSALTFPPQKYMDILFKSKEHISYCSTDYGVYFGCLKLLHDTSLRLVLGPVSNIPYAQDDVHRLYMDYVVPGESHSAFRDFLQTCPTISLPSFLHKLIFIHYCLNQEICSIHDFIELDSEENIEQTEQLYETKESFSQNKSYAAETIVMNCIRNGDPDGLQNFDLNDSSLHVGIIGSSALRQLKNNLIVTTTLCTRAAIEGGLDHDTAYQLSDYFIKTGEQLQSADALYSLLSKVSYTFAEKVHEIQLPVSANDMIQKAIRYIQQNTNQHITASNVAEHVGFSRSYFSSLFKTELGFSLCSFITRCKLEEGKRLLRYTSKPIHVISNYLCFSSQSHFQTAFKKQYGISPLQYRKDPSRLNH